MSAAIPLPIGVTFRPLPDRYARFLSAAYIHQNGVSGQNSYVGIFNNATDGTDLRIYAVAVDSNPSVPAVFEWVSGNPGTLYTGASPYGAIDPRNYNTPGQAIAFTSAVCVGSHIGGILSPVATAALIAPGWPLAIIPPGYSFLVQLFQTNTPMDGYIWWLPVPGPLTSRV